MRIVVLAPGSRGDVQPHVALARALVDRGYAVTLVADPTFAPLAAQNNVAFAAAAFDMRSVLAEEQDAFARTRNPLALLRGLTRRSAEMARAWSAVAIPLGREADLILAAGGAIYMALSLAEATGRPVIQTMLQPFFPTRAFPSPIIPPADWPGFVNLLSHRAMFWLFHVMFRHSTNLVRSELGLAPWPMWPPQVLRRPAYRALCAVSAAIVPPPSDLPSYVEYSGYWFLDDRNGWTPSQELADFLAAGPPPLYVGFSSVVDRNARGSTALILAALARSGQRAILAKGWGGLDHTKPSQDVEVLLIEEAPHDRLLPLCAGILHHGGAGTTAAAIRAGLPQIVAPFMADQPFWADRMRQLGVAALTTPKAKLTAGDLCTAFTRLVEDSGLRQRALALAQRVGSEDGLAMAVAQIEAIFRQTRRVGD